MKYKVEHTDKIYKLGVLVKNSGGDNGSGHVSSILIKEDKKKNKIHHTSFFPSGNIGTFINGLSFGSIPVKGDLAKDHVEDLHEANHVLMTEISKEQYKSVKKAKEDFSEEVLRGRRIYSVFGALNPFANGLTKLIEGATGSRLTVKNHKENGISPTEDICGFDVHHDEFHQSKKLELDNCSGLVTKVVRTAGYDFKNPVIPTCFPSELKKHGFEEIEKESVFKPKF